MIAAMGVGADLMSPYFRGKAGSRMPSLVRKSSAGLIESLPWPNKKNNNEGSKRSLNISN